MQKNFAPPFIVPLSLAVAALFGAPSLVYLAQAQPADAAPAEYPDVPLGDPAYEDFVTAFSQQHMDAHLPWRRNRPHTRYEFVVALARIWEQSKQDESINYRASRNLQALEALRRLIAQFQTELENMNVDKEMRTWLFQVAGMTEVPIGDPAYTDVITAFPDGIGGIDGYLLRKYPHTRYEFAAAIARILQQNATNYHPRPAGQNPKRQTPQALAALYRLIIQFQPDLKSIGAEEEAERRLREIESIISANKAPDKDTIVVLEDSAYGDLKILYQAASPSGDPSLIPYRTFGNLPNRGQKSLTRFEFALILADFFLPAIPARGPTYVAHRRYAQQVQQSPRASAALRRLIVQFQPELEHIGLEPEIQAIQKEGEPTYLVSQSKPQPLKAEPAEYPDVPLGDPVYKDFVTAFSDKMANDLLFWYGINGHPLTRYDFAVALARLLETGVEEGFKQRMSQDPQALAALHRLVVQFRPDLKNLGVTEVVLQGWLREIAATQPAKPQPLKAEPFADVPRGHWAFTAVERLREDGIVAGYADGAYQRSITK